MATVSHALPPTELVGDGGYVVPLKNAAQIVKTNVGYRYQAGQQDSHLVITQVGNKVRFADTGTRELRKFPRSCTEKAAATGIVAECKIPKKFRSGQDMFLEIWPRLGNDYVNASSLSSSFRLWALLDAGHDTALGGAGDDFINGAQDNDTAHGGAGNDWIRTGIGNDNIWGDAGDDRLAGVDGHDQVRGGSGNDQVGGGNGDDKLWGDTGSDKLICGTGTDNAWHDGADSANACESMARI
jgi:Ca2+-binding RTX toxin-like protein